MMKQENKDRAMGFQTQANDGSNVFQGENYVTVNNPKEALL